MDSINYAALKRAFLVWFDDPERTKQRTAEVEWKLFRDRVQEELKNASSRRQSSGEA